MFPVPSNPGSTLLDFWGAQSTANVLKEIKLLEEKSAVVYLQKKKREKKDDILNYTVQSYLTSHWLLLNCLNWS